VTLSFDLATASASFGPASLAQTGPHGQLALIIGGIAIALLVIGGVALIVVRRRRSGGN
jgi:LPXTG-motif cell wall-anchored protein